MKYRIRSSCSFSLSPSLSLGRVNLINFSRIAQFFFLLLRSRFTFKCDQEWRSRLCLDTIRDRNGEGEVTEKMLFINSVSVLLLSLSLSPSLVVYLSFLSSVLSCSNILTIVARKKKKKKEGKKDRERGRC